MVCGHIKGEIKNKLAVIHMENSKHISEINNKRYDKKILEKMKDE